jgi:hypothetical protein
MDNTELLKAMQMMMDDNQAKAEANRKADQAKGEAKMERQIGSLASDMKANQAKAEANMQRIVTELKADWDTHMQEVVAKTVSAIEEKLEAIVHSSRSERDEKIQRRSENVTERQEIPKEGAAVASLECQESSPKEWESEAERREFSEKEVAEKSSKVTKKRSRGRRIAAGRRVKPTKLTREECESRRRLVAVCRKVSRRATVAWRKRTIFRDIRTQKNCGRRQELGAAGVMVTLRAKLARRKGTVRRNRFRATVTRGTRRARTPQEGNMGRKDPGGSWSRYLMKGRTSTTNGITTTKDIGAWTSRQQLLPGSRRMHTKALYEVGSGKNAKQDAGSSAMIWSCKEWTLWRGRPPPKRLKREPHT